jgi:2-keto-4-pentenoate hydratase
MTAWGHDPAPLSSEAIVRRETMGPIERKGFDAPSLGHPLNALAWLADKLAAAGTPL